MSKEDQKPCDCHCHQFNPEPSPHCFNCRWVEGTPAEQRLGQAFINGMIKSLNASGIYNAEGALEGYQIEDVFYWSDEEFLSLFGQEAGRAAQALSSAKASGQQPESQAKPGSGDSVRQLEAIFDDYDVSRGARIEIRKLITTSTLEAEQKGIGEGFLRAARRFKADPKYWADVFVDMAEGEFDHKPEALTNSDGLGGSEGPMPGGLEADKEDVE